MSEGKLVRMLVHTGGVYVWFVYAVMNALLFTFGAGRCYKVSGVQAS